MKRLYIRTLSERRWNGNKIVNRAYGVEVLDSNMKHLDTTTSITLKKVFEKLTSKGYEVIKLPTRVVY